MSNHLLMIDDDARLCEMLTEYLSPAGFVVESCLNAAEGLAMLSKRVVQQQCNAVILDLMLPDADGLEVCRKIRQTLDIPILMLTARGDAFDRIVGLEMGADDYLPKPFEPRELLARLKTILRRSQKYSGNPLQRFGKLEIDNDAREVRVDGIPCELTSYQFDLLAVLASHAGKVLSREQLMDRVKGEPLEAFDRSIDVHISRIRAAIEDNPKKPKRIITLRGSGYVFARSQDGEDGL